jgi:hypothetical protein
MTGYPQIKVKSVRFVMETDDPNIDTIRQFPVNVVMKPGDCLTLNYKLSEKDSYTECELDFEAKKENHEVPASIIQMMEGGH